MTVTARVLAKAYELLQSAINVDSAARTSPLICGSEAAFASSELRVG